MRKDKIDVCVQEALAECWRANKNEIKQYTECQKRGDLRQLMEETQTTNMWDDLNWHAGYIHGLVMARTLLTHK